MAYFITLEGSDGSGKSTLLGQIQNHFAQNNAALLCTREPGGSPLGEEIRKLLLEKRENSDLEPTPLTELLLLQAARAQHVEKVIRPALKKNTHVLCDRFTHSSLAYQGYGRALGLELVQALNEIATTKLQPDAVIWLQITPEQAQKRTQSRGGQDRLDQESALFRQRVFEGFTKISQNESTRFIVLDATQTPAKVFSDLLIHPLWKKLFGALHS